MKNQKTLSEKLKSYSLLASALIGSEAVANAQVIYTDLDPDVTNYGVSAYSLDLNNDGVVDFTLEGDAHHDGGVECTTSSCWGFTNNSQSVKVSPAPGNSVAIASGYPAIAGYLINSNLMWNDNSEQRLGLFSSWWVSGGGSGGGTTGYWYCADKKFLPLRFIFNGEEHYGWVRLSVACEYQSFTIHDYAYEQQPDTPIIAGCISGSILYADMDEDGYGDPGNSSFFSDCRQSGYLTDHSDCNDNNANLHPGVCDGTNGIDDNCDGVIDDGYGTTTFYADNDEDGYGSINSYVNECSTPGGYVTNSADCDDANSTIHPGVPELPNGIDDNCTGLIDDIGNAPCDGVMLSLGVNGPYDTHGATVDPDEVSPPRGTCSASGYWCNNTSSNLSNSLWFSFVAPASGNVTIQSPDFDTQLALWKVSDCADYSTYTLVDASDDEPNYAAHGGVIYSSYMGSYNCSHQLVPGETYYVQLDPWSANGSTRIVLTDAGTPVDAVVFYTDNDGDGFGDPQVSVSLCNQTSGYVSNSTDCDDANSSLNPGAEEVINCIDDNCNGIIDEGKWIQKANFGGTARYNAVGFTIGSKAYLGTGKTAANGYKKDFWEYDPVTNVWTQKANFGGTARYKATGFAIGTKGYIGTGYDLNGALVKSFWEYDPATNTWTQKAAFGGTARQNAVGFSIGSKGYIGTGITAANEYKKDFWEYDPATDTWTQKANAGNTVREAAVGFSIGSKGYIGTGNNSNGYKKDFWEYDPATDTWTQKAAFGGTARQGATGFSIDTKGYIATGYDGSYKNDFWEYDPSTNTWKQDVDFTGSVRAYAVGFSVSGKGYIGTGNNSSSTFNDFREYTAPVFVGLKVYADADGDGFGDPGNSIITSDCVVPSGYVTNGSDCDDANAAINPNGIPVKQWDVRFGGTLDDRLSKVQQTTDGGYIVGGRSKSGNSGDKTQANRDGTNATWDYWIVKTDAAGVKQWNKRFGGTKNDELVTLQQTLDGGYILGGHGYSGLNGDKSQANYDATEATADYWIVKTDASGIKQWDFRYGGSGDDQFQDLQLTTDGGYILGGYSSSGISGDKSQASQGDADYWIIKINSAGVKQWDARYGGTNADYLYDLEQTADGGYILGGRSYSGIGGDKTQANWDGSNTTFDYWIVKTDANGVKQWDKRFGGTGDDVLYALKQASGGGYILAGYSESGIGGDKTQATQGGTDYWMVKTDANGTKLWDTRFGGSSDEQLFVLERSSDDGYLLSGYSNSGISGDKTQSNQGVRDFWIVKTDNTGAKKWDLRFGGTKADVTTSLQSTADGGCIAGGYSFSGATGDRSQANWDASLLTQDYWIVKLTSGTGRLIFYADADGDGYGNPGVSVSACTAPAGYVSNPIDCNDDPDQSGASIHPNASDICNDIDDNCNGVIDENAITATITPSGSVSTCSGVAITLTANTGSGITYQWLKNSTNISGATNSTHPTSTAASYQVSEINNFSCASTSPVTTLSVIAKPAATITPLGNLDICATGSVVLQANSGAGLTYQWLKGGNNVSGATNQTYTATKKATYKVIVTNSSGCSKTSTGVKVVNTCKQASFESEQISFQVYPNPAEDHATIQFTLPHSSHVYIKVYDVSGKEIETLLDDDVEQGEHSVLLNTNQFSKGVYLVKMISPAVLRDGIENQKLIVQ